MPLRPDMEFKDYLEVVLRRKWFVAYAFAVLMSAAVAYCVVAPELYRSSTTILIVPQRIPENYVRSTVSARPEERLAAIQQQVMSRTQLTSVIQELGLLRGGRNGQGLDEAIEQLRRRIELQVRREDDRSDSSGGAAIKLSVVHEDRRMAMLVASRLASIIIDENLKTRELQATGTAEFLDSQLKEVKERLAGQEEKVKQYKMSFMGELPQQLEANLQMLRGLQDQMRTNAEEIRGREDRKVFIEAQLAEIERMMSAREPVVLPEDAPVEAFPADAPYADPAASLVAELSARKARLADLTARYTEQYPEVPRARKEIEALERRIEEVRRNAVPPPSRDNAARNRAPRRILPPSAASGQEGRLREEMARLKAQAVANAAEIESYRSERAQVQRNMTALEQKVGKMPKREQEMIALTRDYENLKRSYDDLLQKKLNADVSQNLEKRQKGEQFQVLDPANLPERPFRPDRARILGLALLVACVLGVGGPLAVEAVDSSVQDAKELRHLVEIPVLASIPSLQVEEALATERRRTVYRILGLVAVAGGLAVLLVLKTDRVRAILNV